MLFFVVPVDTPKSFPVKVLDHPDIAFGIRSLSGGFTLSETEDLQEASDQVVLSIFNKHTVGSGVEYIYENTKTDEFLFMLHGAITQSDIDTIYTVILGVMDACNAPYVYFKYDTKLTRQEFIDFRPTLLAERKPLIDKFAEVLLSPDDDYSSVMQLGATRSYCVNKEQAKLFLEDNNQFDVFSHAIQEGYQTRTIPHATIMPYPLRPGVTLDSKDGFGFIVISIIIPGQEFLIPCSPSPLPFWHDTVEETIGWRAYVMTDDGPIDLEYSEFIQAFNIESYPHSTSCMHLVTITEEDIANYNNASA